MQWIQRVKAHFSSVPTAADGGRSAVIVGCARDVAKHLPNTLKNIEAIATVFEQVAYVFVENDSTDSTKADLRRWLKTRSGRGHLLNLDGAAARIPKRTERLAKARNAYINYVRKSRYRDFDYLVVFDFDDVNSSPIKPDEVRSAVEFLEKTGEAQAVFSNSIPFYYDIWALRHPDCCPYDCWAEVRAEGHLSRSEAIAHYVHKRQIAIPPETSPIRVDSAFGGIGIYRMTAAKSASYHGLNANGNETCEHVTFNRDVGKSGSLYIFPALRNHAPREHLSPVPDHLKDARELPLQQNGQTCVLLAPSDHRLDQYRNSHPLYDRRLPILASIVSSEVPTGCIVDVGANIGDTVALCRMAGCDREIVAVEPSERYFAFLTANMAKHPNLFGSVRPVRAFIGPPNESLALNETCGTASVRFVGNGEECPANTNAPTLQIENLITQPVSLIKTDTDGYDAIVVSTSIDLIESQQPILWLETDVTTQAEELEWVKLLKTLEKNYSYICAFDNFGFLAIFGRLDEKLSSLIDFIGYARRHRHQESSKFGEPRIYYFDIALFPEKHSKVFELFLSQLHEAHG